MKRNHYKLGRLFGHDVTIHIQLYDGAPEHEFKLIHEKACKFFENTFKDREALQQLRDQIKLDDLIDYDRD